VLSLNGEYGVVDDILIEDRTQTMYNLTVDVVHTFAVGDGEWVVHNLNKNCRYESRRIDHDDYGRGTEIRVHSEVNDNHLATIRHFDEFGGMDMYIKTKDITTDPPSDITGADVTGREIFDDVWEMLDGDKNVNVIVGDWSANPSELSTNFRIFEDNINKKNMSREDAAKDTPTGSYADSKGFEDVTIQRYTEGDNARILYRRK